LTWNLAAPTFRAIHALCSENESSYAPEGRSPPAREFRALVLFRFGRWQL
jgi:hypothetical protein